MEINLLYFTTALDKEYSEKYLYTLMEKGSEEVKIS